MKSLLAPSAAAVALAAPALLLHGTELGDPAPKAPEAARAPAPELQEHSGVVTAAGLEMDGTVFVRLRVTAGGSGGKEAARELWFRSPPDRSSVIGVEDMLLDFVLDAGPEDVLTCVTEFDRTRDGSSREKARPLVRITRH